MITLKLKPHQKNFVKLGESPQRDWHFALGCFVVGLVAVVVIDGLLFISLSNERVATPTENSPISLDRDEISETVKVMKAGDLNSAIITESVRRDPSK